LTTTTGVLPRAGDWFWVVISLRSRPRAVTPP